MNKIYNRYTKETCEFNFTEKVVEIEKLNTYENEEKLINYALENLSSFFDAYEFIVDIRSMDAFCVSTKRNQSSVNACFEITLLKINRVDLQDEIERFEENKEQGSLFDQIFYEFDGCMLENVEYQLLSVMTED